MSSTRTAGRDISVASRRSRACISSACPGSRDVAPRSSGACGTMPSIWLIKSPPSASISTITSQRVGAGLSCGSLSNKYRVETMLKRRSVLAGTAGWTIVGVSAVRGQAWPNGPVKIVVPYIPGGATDTAGRLVAEKMTALLGQQVIVENRGGGNTIIGMELVAKSKPDGQTLLLG